MNKIKEKHISKMIKDNGLYITTDSMKKVGLNSYDINMLLLENRIERLRRGIYRLMDSEIETNEMTEASSLVPNGILCLFSAFSYYELTTYIPKEYTIAIPLKARKPLLPMYPPIKIYYFSDKRFNIGITTISISGLDVKIYDLEKTICDAVIYRNKIGIDIVKEVLERYIVRRERNLQRLMEYAKDLRIYDSMKKYMEVLI
jgi:predicted transcriptional regulator of viral defense system